MKIHLLTGFIAIWVITETKAIRKWSSIKIRNDVFNHHVREESFIDLPTCVEDAHLMGFELVPLEEEFCYPLYLYCPQRDPRWCLFYDEDGSLAGIQISYLEEDLLNVDRDKYSFNQPSFKKTYFYNLPAYSFRVYFTNPTQLIGVGSKNASEAFEGLWAELDGVLVRFDRKCQPNSPVIGNFDMQGCYDRIGQIYVRNFNEKTRCEDVFFLYLLYSSGSLVGFGHGIPGIAKPGPHYNIYNHPRGPPVHVMLPNPPPCFKDYYQFGFSVVNVYITENPWGIRCRKCHCDEDKLYV